MMDKSSVTCCVNCARVQSWCRLLDSLPHRALVLVHTRDMTGELKMRPLHMEITATHSSLNRMKDAERLLKTFVYWDNVS